MHRSLLGNCFLVLLISFNTILAQEPAPKKLSSSELLLQKALQNSPEIREAEAKLQLASIEVEKAKLKVSQALMSELSEIEELQTTIRLLRDEVDELAKTQQGGKASLAVVAASQKIRSAESEIRRRQSKLDIQLKEPTGGISFKVPLGEAVFPQRQPEVAAPDEEHPMFLLYKDIPPSSRERITKNLKMPVKLPEDHDELPLSDILNFFQSASKHNLVIKLPNNHDKLPKISLKKGELTLGDWLLMIQDDLSENGLKFVVRPYGLLLTTSDPEGSVPLSNYLNYAGKEGEGV
jgi:hypothetical protein